MTILLNLHTVQLKKEGLWESAIIWLLAVHKEIWQVSVGCISKEYILLNRLIPWLLTSNESNKACGHEPNPKNSFPSICFKQLWLLADLFLTSPLAGTDGPVELSAGGLWARGEEGLSFSSTSVVTTSTVSSSCIGVSGVSTEEKSVSKHDALNTPHTSLSNTTQHWPLWLSLLGDFFIFF